MKLIFQYNKNRNTVSATLLNMNLDGRFLCTCLSSKDLYSDWWL